MTKYQAIWEDGYRVVWRNLTWSEYRRFESRYLEESSRFSRPIGVSLEIYKTIRLDGPVPEVVPAGIVIYIAQQQLKTNPFNGTYEDISGQLFYCRNLVSNNYLHTARSIVAAAFKYSFEEMDEWDPVLFFTRVAQAEVVLGKLIDPTRPEAPGKQSPKRPLSARERTLLRVQERDKKPS